MSSGTSSRSTKPQDADALLEWAWHGALFVGFLLIAQAAYEIRMGAIREYGPVIHEFDPYFNYRATEVS